MTRSFCVIDYGTCEGQEGYWVEDDQTFEEGFVPEYEDTFWTMDEYGYWSARPFQGRRLRRGAAKGKGKGGKGRRRFTSHYKRKGREDKARDTTQKESTRPQPGQAKERAKEKAKEKPHRRAKENRNNHKMVREWPR
jgi:hypothetical protein